MIKPRKIDMGRLNAHWDNCACGPRWMPRSWRCAISGKINAACVDHDMRYGKPGQSRRKADSQFRRDVMDQLQGENWWWRNLFGRGFIIPMVYVWGWTAKKPRWMDD